MADYDWGFYCHSCGRSIRFGGSHAGWCTQASAEEQAKYFEEEQMKALGFEPDSTTKAYRCTRGCGCIVWDVEAHRKSVCRDQDPVEL